MTATRLNRRVSKLVAVVAWTRLVPECRSTNLIIPGNDESFFLAVLEVRIALLYIDTRLNMQSEGLYKCKRVAYVLHTCYGRIRAKNQDNV